MAAYPPGATPRFPLTVGNLEDALSSATSALEARGIPYMVIGGIANLVWGVARTTQDIDITVDVEPADLPETVSALSRILRALPQDPLEFIQQTRVLPMLANNDTRVDLIFAELPYQHEAILRASSVRLGSTSVRVCSAEDLIIHKIISERPKDLDDVKGIVRAQAKRLDRAYLDPLVFGLSVDLERPEIQELYTSLWSD